MNNIAQEIALELSVQTGQVYTCPDGERIQGPDRAYSIRQFWRDNKILQIWAAGPTNYYRAGSAIKCSATRPPEAIARDIRNRIPNAATFYAEALAEMEEKERIERLCKEQDSFFRSMELDVHQYNSRHSVSEGHNIRGYFEAYKPEDVTVTVSNLTAAQAAQLIEFTRNLIKQG
jgi:hypothetical protein